MYAGDLYSGGSDVGTGLYTEGPQRFIGAFSRVTGTTSGFEESPEAPRWSASQELDAAQMWADLLESENLEVTFKDTLEPLEVNDGAGAEWDQYVASGLAPGASAGLAIINRARVPSGLVVTPTSQSLTTGSTVHVTFAAFDLAGGPYSGATLHYTVAGSNPQSGRLTLDGSGRGQLSYLAANVGHDTITAFVDLAGDGVQATGDPTGTATVDLQTSSGAEHEDGPAPPAIFKAPGNLKARAADAFKMYLKGVASHRRTLRLTHVVVLGTHRGETVYLFCSRCSGRTARERIIARGTKARFSPKRLVVTSRSSLLIDVLASGLDGRYKAYRINLSAGSATVEREGCLLPGSTVHTACPS